MNQRTKTFLRNLMVLIVGVGLSIGLMSAGTFIVLRTTSTGQLLSDLNDLRDDPEAASKLVAIYGDPLALFTERFPFLLNVAAFFVSLFVVGSLEPSSQATLHGYLC